MEVPDPETKVVGKGDQGEISLNVGPYSHVIIVVDGGQPNATPPDHRITIERELSNGQTVSNTREVSWLPHGNAKNKVRAFSCPSTEFIQLTIENLGKEIVDSEDLYVKATCLEMR
jgi:hypothetical protein